MAAVLHKNRTAECLEVVLESLREPMRTEPVRERERATMTVHFLLTKYHEYSKESGAGSWLVCAADEGRWRVRALWSVFGDAAASGARRVFVDPFPCD